MSGVMDVDRQDYKNEVRNLVMAKTGYVLIQQWTAPLAASSTAVHAAMSSAALVTTGITSPAHPRVLSITGGGSGHAATGNVVINGTDMRGTTISDTIALSGNSTVNGAKAFATVTSIDLTGVSGIDANDTVAVGTSALLGLDRRLPANTVFVYTVDGAKDSAAPTVTSNATVGGGNLALNTVSFATAPNGTHNFLVVFVTQEITTSNAITS